MPALEAEGRGAAADRVAPQELPTKRELPPEAKQLPERQREEMRALREKHREDRRALRRKLHQEGKGPGVPGGPAETKSP